MTLHKADFAVAEKLKFEGRQELAAMDRAVEMEDSEGNVYDKKVSDFEKWGHASTADMSLRRTTTCGVKV
jgi:hypothetical protein